MFKQFQYLMISSYSEHTKGQRQWEWNYKDYRRTMMNTSLHLCEHSET